MASIPFAFLQGYDGVRSPIFRFGVQLLDVERRGQFADDIFHRKGYFFIPGPTDRCAFPTIPRLHLQYNTEKTLRSRGEETDFRVGMEAVEVGRLGREGLVNVAVVGLVVDGWREPESGGQIEIVIDLNIIRIHLVMFCHTPDNQTMEKTKGIFLVSRLTIK